VFFFGAGVGLEAAALPRLKYRVPKYPADVADASTAKLSNIIPNNESVRPRRQLPRVDVVRFEFLWA